MRMQSKLFEVARKSVQKIRPKSKSRQNYLRCFLYFFFHLFLNVLECVVVSAAAAVVGFCCWISLAIFLRSLSLPPSLAANWLLLKFQFYCSLSLSHSLSL